MDSASAQTAAIVVNTTVDNIDAGDGNCTLREAINNANRNRDTTNGDCRAGSPHPTIDAIAFNIQSAQPSIIPKSPLPTITEAVVIDGTSQPGFQTTATYSLICPNPRGVLLPAQTLTISRPVVELNGAAAGKVSGITIDADQVIIRGLVINRFQRSGIQILNSSSQIIIESNYIGTDISGTVALGNNRGVVIKAGNTTNPNNTIIKNNVISGNTFLGVLVNGDANADQHGNTIENNLIGTDITGTVALSPILSTDGIGIKKPANQIRSNVIGGNRRHGIHIYRGFGTQPWDNRIENNYIGINPNGINIANGGDGIAIFSNIYTPGTVLPLMDVLIRGTRITENAIANNGHNGIRLEARGDEAGFNASITNTRISNNTIYDNGANGIQITTVETIPGGMAEAIDNLIQTNSLFNNQSLGISLSSSRSTSHDAFLNGETGNHLSTSVPIENDVLDLDSGSNQLQNHPTLLSAEVKNNNTEIQGILISTPNTQFTIEFFANRSADPSNYGEGEVPLGSLSVTTDNRGEAGFTAVLPATVLGQSITATATDSKGNTSEFSRRIQLKFSIE